MTDRATLQALLNRVLEGTGPDRELDGEIGAAFRVLPTNSVGPNVLGWLRRWEGPFVTDPALPGHILTENRINWKAPPYTESLDAVLRDLLPEGWHAEIGTRPDWPWARLFRDAPLRVTDIVSGPTPPRALMAACLKAKMEAQGE